MNSPDLYFCVFNRDIAKSTTQSFVDSFANRLLPIFDDIEAEAKAKMKEAWDTAMSKPSDGSDDPSDFIGPVDEYGQQVYESLRFTRQQLIGLSAAGLYHLWERLLKDFLRTELRWGEVGKTPANINKAVFADLEKLLASCNFHISSMPYYKDLDELRLVANVIKHGEGKACNDLYETSQHLFGKRADFQAALSKAAGRLEMADFLELGREDFLRYARSIQDFWETFPEKLSKL